MAWTTPRTWVSGETVTHTELNDHIRDNLNFLHSKDHCSVYDSSDEPLTDATWEVLNFDSENFDSNSMHNPASANSRVKCNSDGLYLCAFKVQFAANTTGLRRAMIRENAAASSTGGTNRGIWNSAGLSGEATTVGGSRLLRLVDTDYIELFAYQDSGITLDVEMGSPQTWLQLMQLAG